MDHMEKTCGLPVHPRTGLLAIGVLPSGRVVWPVLGGAPDDDDDTGTDDGQDNDADDRDDQDQDDDAGGGNDDQDDADDSKGKADDTVSRAALDRAIRERQNAKAKLRKKEQELEELRRASEGAEEKAAREAREAAVQEAEAKLKPIAIRAALLEAGVRPGRVKGATKLLELKDIDVDEDGGVTGLDEQLDNLREDWPELFTPAQPEKPKAEKRRGPGSKSADGADKKPETKKPMTATERQAAALLGKN